MFSAQFITIFFAAMLLAVGALVLIQKRGWIAIEGIILAVGLGAAVYCVAAGVFLLSGWQDPFASASSQEVGQAAATHGGRGGVVILAIRFWPYVLMGLGSYFGYGYLLGLVRLTRVTSQ